MANKSIFQSIRGALAPATTTRNDAGGVAYELSPKAALARMAATGCVTRTFYCSAEVQLDRVLALANAVDTDFLAQTAIYSRQTGFMKDMPALLCAVLAVRDRDRLVEVFPQVIDNGKMLRNFVQIVRSGVTGRKSLGSAPKRLVRQWLERATERQLLSAAIGNDPSLADVVKMVHPRPSDTGREAFYAWLIGKPHDSAALPEAVRAYQAWKNSREGDVPDVPFQLLAAYLNTGDVPVAIREALQDAMETAIGNVPAIQGEIVICPDVSGSMKSPVTGYKKGASSKVRCIDVAAFLRKNRTARVLPFEVDVVDVKLNPRTPFAQPKLFRSSSAKGLQTPSPYSPFSKSRMPWKITLVAGSIPALAQAR